MTLGTITINHPQWDEFADRLHGPEGCDFREDDSGSPSWRCLGGHSLAEGILRDMGASDDDLAATIEYFKRNGGYCDCEILVNVDREPAPPARFEPSRLARPNRATRP